MPLRGTVGRPDAPHPFRAGERHVSSKRILVAGGGGFIGGHLVDFYRKRGHRVRSVDVKPLDQWYQVPSTTSRTWSST